MSTETYEILALAARYWFLLLAALFVLKGIANSRSENRKEKSLREWAGGAGCVGELVVLEDGVKNRKRSIRGARFPVPEEGLIGSGRIADIRIRHGEVNKRHLRFSYRPGELVLQPIGRAESECPVLPDGTLVLRDGDKLTIGNLEMMMVFFGVQDAAVNESAPRKVKTVKKKEEDEFEDPFEDHFWE